MLSVSNGFKVRILGSEGFVDIFDRGAIFLYEGARPATADEPAPVPVAIVTEDGNEWEPPNIGFGLRFAQLGPYIIKANTTWKLRALATTAGVTWARLVGPEVDTGVLNYELPRIDFDVGLTGVPNGEELLLPKTAFTLGESLIIGDFNYTFLPIVS